MTNRSMRAVTHALAIAGSAVLASSAGAADLGGNCCADLEERIAELEATTARKGNRKVSLTISGQVHTGVLFFDDGVEANAYVADQDNTSSRFRLLGNAKIDANWSAGFLLEVETESTGASTNTVTQLADDGGAAAIALRHSAWWIEHKQFGRVWVGQTSPATDDIILADTAGAGPAAFADQLVGNSLIYRNAAGNLITNGATTLSSNVVTGGSFDTARRNLVRYDTPTIAGFRATATWGEDDFWDVALWYAGKIGDFKIVGGIGYFQDTDGFASGEQQEEFKGSISVLHEPSGLFGSFAFVDRDFELNNAADPRRSGTEYYYFNGGIALPKLLPVGKTVLYGEYGTADGVSSVVNVGAALGGNVTSAELQTFGFGVVQHVPAAELEIYGLFKQLDLDARTATTQLNTQEINIVFTGARIKF